jgi:PAS domain S-box-containing protein
MAQCLSDEQSLKLAELEAQLADARAALARSEAERATIEATLDTLMDRAPMSVIRLDAELRIINASRAWLADVKVERADAIGRCVYDVTPGAKAFADKHQRALAGEVVGEDEAEILRPDGTARSVRYQLAPWRLPSGEIGGIVVMSCDISDLVATREAMIHTERRLTQALEMDKSVAWEMSLINRRVYATGAIEAVYDEPPTYKSFAHDLFVAVHPEDRPRVEKAWSEHVLTGAPLRVEYRINRQDGQEVWVHAVAETLRGPNGRPERVVGVLKNITENKRAAMALAEAGKAAEAANLAKSEFLANMSHEIRTPLNGVMGVAGALARTPLQPAQREMVALIESSAHTLERLLTDVLDLARVESGRVEIRQDSFEVCELMRTVAALFEPRAHAKKLDFELKLGAGVEPGQTYLGDAVRLRQILSNLISNAVKFTERGGVKVAVRAQACGETTRLRFRVEDTGIGFDPAAKARLFQRFEQADGSITRRYGGSGLGLAISRSLAERMGGRLEAWSKPGQGSIFELTLDMQPGEVAPVAGEAEATPAGAAGFAPRVLLAEDHPANRKVVELVLGSIGVELVEVENGAEAVEACEDEIFDLILMDMQMPVMDGLTAIRGIRAREKVRGRRPVPILALSANALPEHVRASHAAGADGHLTKPISAAVLIEAVQTACNGGYDGESMPQAANA